MNCQFNVPLFVIATYLTRAILPKSTVHHELFPEQVPEQDRDLHHLEASPSTALLENPLLQVDDCHVDFLNAIFAKIKICMYSIFALHRIGIKIVFDTGLFFNFQSNAMIKGPASAMDTCNAYDLMNLTIQMRERKCSVPAQYQFRRQ